MYPRRMSKNAMTMTVMLAAVMVGLLTGFINIHCTEALWENLFYCLASLALAYVRPKLLWLWPMVFAITLYAVHLWAIRHGFRPPYVERNEDAALYCLLVFFPALFGGLAGGGIRAALDWSRENF